MLFRSQIFNGCPNFVLSGCQLSGSTITPGFVYLNGKIRHFQGASNITSFPQYIYESNSVENVAYASGSDKVGREIYGCAIGSVVPTSLDPLTNAVPQHIAYSASGARTLKEAFFGRYSLLLDSQSQRVAGDIELEGTFKASGSLEAGSSISVKGGGKIGKIFFDNNGDMVFDFQATNGNTSLCFSDGLLSVSVNGEMLATFSENGVNVAGIKAGEANLGSTTFIGNNIFNSSSFEDTGAININMLGYDSGYSKFRNTYIGNGKNAVVVRVIGSTSEVFVDGALHLGGNTEKGVVLRSLFTKANHNLQKHMAWQDANGEDIAFVGYTSEDDQCFDIRNALAPIFISAVEYVNIGPAIKEGGVLLSDKYVLSSAYSKDMAKVALANDVYTKEAAGDKFANKLGGLVQFVNPTNTANVLRASIGAVSLEDVRAECLSKSMLLADVAATDAQKRSVCANIGAAYNEDIQTKLKDTGWLLMVDNLYIRQVGNVVTIQGTVVTTHDGVAFTIPNKVDPPTHAVSTAHSLRGSSINWKTSIKAGSRDCVVDYCDHHNYQTIYSLTYMV